MQTVRQEGRIGAGKMAYCQDARQGTTHDREYTTEGSDKGNLKTMGYIYTEEQTENRCSES